MMKLDSKTNSADKSYTKTYTILLTFVINCSFAVCCTLYGISHAILASLATPLILEVHGEHRVELVFGLEMMFFGISVLISPPIAREFMDYEINLSENHCCIVEVTIAVLYRFLMSSL